MSSGTSRFGLLGVLLFAGSIMVFISALGYRWAEREGYFDLETVRVRGCRASDSAAVAGAVRPFMRQPLGRVDMDSLTFRLMSLEGVSGVEASRRWPTTVLVEIILEKPAMLLVSPGGDACVLSTEGRRLPESFSVDTLPLAVLASPADTTLIPALLEWAESVDAGRLREGHLEVLQGCAVWVDAEARRILLGSAGLTERWGLYLSLVDVGIEPPGWKVMDLRYDGQAVLRWEVDEADHSAAGAGSPDGEVAGFEWHSDGA